MIACLLNGQYIQLANSAAYLSDKFLPVKPF